MKTLSILALIAISATSALATTPQDTTVTSSGIAQLVPLNDYEHWCP